MENIKNLQNENITTSANDEMMGFIGTENYYSSQIFGCNYTDGVKYMVENYKAYWLVNLICSYQYRLRSINSAEFQVWDLTKVKGTEFVLICTDGNNNILIQKKIEFSDFPFDTVKLFLTDTILMLPSEY